MRNKPFTLPEETVDKMVWDAFVYARTRIGEVCVCLN